MGLEEIIPSIGLILVLILIFPSFIKSNLKKKVLIEPEKFISYLDLLLVNVQRLNTVFLQSEKSIEEVVQKLFTYKNSL